MESATIGKLAEALAKAQGQMDNAKKDSLNPHFKNKYADLAAVIDAVKEPLAKNGLSYVQYFEDDNYLITKIMHSSGEWISGRMKLLLQKQDMQGLGSATTYARRQGLTSMIGIAQEDDDGNASTGQRPKEAFLRHAEEPSAPIAPIWKFEDKHMDTLKQLAAKAGLTGKDVIQMATKKLEDLNAEEYAALIGSIQKRIVTAS